MRRIQGRSDKPRLFSVGLPTVSTCLACFLASLLIARGLGGAYLDERYYLEVGARYAACVPPALSNPEHPPLGKYLVGALLPLGAWVAPAAFGALSALLLAASVGRLRGDPPAPALASVALASEVAFAKTFGYALLDPFAVGFSAAATYASMFYPRPLLSGLLWGAALASKLSAAYPFLGVLLLRLWERRYRDALAEVLTAGAVYAASFAGDLLCPGGSADLLVSHLLFVPSFMLRVHGLSVHKAVQGLGMALLKLNFWSSNPPVTVTLAPGSWVEVALLPGGPSGVEVEVHLWLSGFLMPSSAALLAYALLRLRSLGREARLAALLALLSYVNVLHGAIPWYLTLPAYYLALLAGLVLSRRALAALAAANVASLLAVHALGLKDTVVLAPWGTLP